MSAGRRILYTGDESPGSLAAVRALRSAGWEPWLAVSQAGTYAAHSRALAGIVELDASDPELYAEALAREASSIRPVAVLPGTEATLAALTGREHLFRGVPVGTAGAGALGRANDKLGLADRCAEAGLRTARAAELALPELEEHEGELSFPAIVKPRRSIEWPRHSHPSRTEARVVDSTDDLRCVLAAAPQERWVVERFVPGTLAAVCGVAWQGEAVCTLHQVSPRTFPPELGVSSYAVTTTGDRSRDAGVRRLMQLIGWSGIFGVQFLTTAEGDYVIDLNPRVYGSLALAVAAGHNLPAIWTDLLLGRRPRPGPYRLGVRYRVEEDDYRVLLHMLRNGRRREALCGALPRSRTTHAVFSLRDPRPAVASVRKLAHKGRRGAGLRGTSLPSAPT